MSPRTAKYVEAMIREGDGFDYDQWLKAVREEEAEAKQTEATGTSGELTRAEKDKPSTMPYGQHVRPNSALPLVLQTIRAPRIVRWPHRQARDATPNARLRLWLEKVRGTCEDFQSSRRRDSVYSYLEAIFAIVTHFRVRRRTNRLLRHAFEFASLPFDKNADPFSAVIRCTCGRDVDNKTISKWARALRYAVAAKKSQTSLKRFIKKMGGINACGSLYAKNFGKAIDGKPPPSFWAL